MRGMHEERELAIGMVLQCFHMPLQSLFAPKPQELTRVSTLLADPAHQPVFIHCDQSVDRTGMIIAVELLLRIDHKGTTASAKTGVPGRRRRALLRGRAPHSRSC